MEMREKRFASVFIVISCQVNGRMIVISRAELGVNAKEKERIGNWKMQPARAKPDGDTAFVLIDTHKS